MAFYPRTTTSDSPATRRQRNIPNQLLKTFANIPADFSGDLFGQIYEYFVAEFARSEGTKGGEFFTSRSIVRLMVEIIEPHGGKVFDPDGWPETNRLGPVNTSLLVLIVLTGPIWHNSAARFGWSCRLLAKGIEIHGRTITSSGPDGSLKFAPRS